MEHLQHFSDWIKNKQTNKQKKKKTASIIHAINMLQHLL